MASLISLLRLQWDRVAASVLIGLGAMLVAVGALRAREAMHLADQLSFIMSGGLGGLMAGTAGGALLVSAGLHDEWRRLNRIQAKMRPLPIETKTEPQGSARWPLQPVRWVCAEWDRSLGCTLWAAAGIVWLVASRELAATHSQAEQIAYLISGGLGAIVLAMVGAALLLCADLQDTEWKLQSLEDALAVAADGGVLRSAELPPLKAAEAERLLRRPLVTIALLVWGSVFVALGWATASRTGSLDRAMDGLALALAGLIVVTTALSVEGLRLRHRVAVRMVRAVGGVAKARASESTDEHICGEDGIWSVDGMTRFHRRSCPAILHASGPTSRVVRAETTLEPCLICDQDS